jgi:hypothetical protein
MGFRPALCKLLALAGISLPGDLAGLQPPPAKQSEDKAMTLDDPTRKGDRLRRQGFLFVELDCRDLEDYLAFFKDVAGFEVNRRQGNFVILRSARSEILLNRVGGKPVRYQGPRVEIGIVVDDLDKAFDQAKKRQAWTIAAGVARQPWGVRDFRVFSPEGYYLRITEGPK